MVLHHQDWAPRNDVQDGTVFLSHPHLFYAEDMLLTSGPRPQREHLRPSDLFPCGACGVQPADEPLVMMDVFGGAGGMSQGFERAGVAEARYHVDISEACCRTFA